MDQQTLEIIKAALTVLQLLTTLGTLCIMIYTFKKFLAKPQETLESRLAQCEAKIAALELKLMDVMKEIERILQLSNDDSKHIKEACKALQSTVYSLVEFELSYCSRTGYEGDVRDLEEAASELHDYLRNK